MVAPYDPGSGWAQPQPPPTYPPAAPYAAVGVPYWGPQGPYAPVDPTDCVGRRVWAAIIDTVILIVPQMLVLVALMWGPVSELLEQASYDSGRSSAPPPEFGGEFLARYFGAIALTWFVNFAYYFVTERVWQGSPGKLMVGLRVVRANGFAPISWGQSAGRNALRVLFDNGLVALICIVLTKGHRRVGDMVAHTLVIPKDWVGRFSEIWPPNGFPPWEPNAMASGQMVLPPQAGYA